MALLTAVGDAMTTVLGWIGSVITSLTTTTGDLYGLLPLFAIGIAISAIMLGVRMIKSFVWGA